MTAGLEASAAQSLHTLSMKDIAGKQTDMSVYKGKVLLVVNVASKCGFTPQYKDLQALQDSYSAKGFSVVGFPSNDFGGQEPGSEKEIKDFCDLNYKVKFPLFSKVKVKGSDKAEVYKFLTESGPADMRGEVSWNFEKFLVSKDGQVIGRYKSKVGPLDAELKGAIEKALR